MHVCIIARRLTRGQLAPVPSTRKSWPFVILEQVCATATADFVELLVAATMGNDDTVYSEFRFT